MDKNVNVKSSKWRLVEVGRVVLINKKTLGCIVEIIDNKRVSLINDFEDKECGLRLTVKRF